MATHLVSAPPSVEANPELDRALDALEHVRRDMIERERRSESVVADLPSVARSSARNLIHYLALRSHDLGAVQRVLAAHGLSSLGRAEPHVRSWASSAVSSTVRPLLAHLGVADHFFALAPPAATARDDRILG